MYKRLAAPSHGVASSRVEPNTGMTFVPPLPVIESAEEEADEDDENEMATDENEQAHIADPSLANDQPLSPGLWSIPNCIQPGFDPASRAASESQMTAVAVVPSQPRQAQEIIQRSCEVVATPVDPGYGSGPSFQSFEDAIHCPKCHSTQITANKRGFSVTKAAVGLVFIPGGILWGLHGRGKIQVTCLKCGYSWKAGKK